MKKVPPNLFIAAIVVEALGIEEQERSLRLTVPRPEMETHHLYIL